MNTARRVGVYYAMSSPAETTADPDRFDQGIGGFIEHIWRRNFDEFVARAGAAAGPPVLEAERVAADGTPAPLAGEFVSGLDTLIIISFDSNRTGQRAAPKELDALRSFLRVPGNLLAVAPHHNIGDDPELEFRHHGDPTIPPEQRFGGFARSILDSLAPGRRSTRPRRRHPFTASGRATFDALLQSRPGVFAGDLIVVDATLWSSTAGGTESLQRFWANLFARQHR
jgi:hypothetical protein